MLTARQGHVKIVPMDVLLVRILPVNSTVWHVLKVSICTSPSVCCDALMGPS